MQQATSKVEESRKKSFIAAFSAFRRQPFLYARVIDSFIRHECVLRLLHAMVLIGCIGLVLISFAYCLSGVLRTALLGSVQVVEIQSVHMPRRCSWMKLLLVFPCGVWHTVVADGCREG